MLNKKGTTLAEVIISIALISVVLVFMVRLLVDLNNMESNTNYASSNQITRAEIIRMIGNDLNDLELTSISDASTPDNLNITFNFSNNTQSTIIATTNTFTYTDSLGNTRNWDITGGTIYPNKVNVYYSVDLKDEENKIFTLIIDIEIHNTNEDNDIDNNNTLDDIIISYLGDASLYTNPLTCLGADCE